MSWITFIWSMTAGICLTLGAVHLLVWTQQRRQWANLVFSIAAAAAAGFAFFDLLEMRAQTPAEYGKLLQLTLTMGMILGVAVAVFIRLYLQAGRLWLLGLICGVRLVTLFLNFVPGPNFYFREMTGLQQVSLLGELISRPLGVLHPWAISMQPSLGLIILFVIDATYTATKRNGIGRELIIGGLTSIGFILGLVFYGLYIRGILPSPFSGQLMLLMILPMAFELSRDALRAVRLAGDLYESEQRFALAADAANLGVWIRGFAPDKFWATDHWRELLGFKAGDRINPDTFLNKIHPEDRETISQTLATALAGGGSYETEYRVVLPAGGIRWIASRGRVDFNSDGAPLIMRGVSIDITDRKRAEDEILQHRNELAHLSRVTTLSEMSSSLAHELNQPLAIILTNAQAAQRLLAQDPPDIAETREILADIVSEDQRAGEVIRRLRAMLKSGETQLSSLSVNEVIGEVLRIVRSGLIGRGVTVHTALAESLPLVMGDRIQLQQVLLNLILNAGDAMVANPESERQLSLATTFHNGVVQIAVSDNGCGLSTEPEKIFQPFYTTKKDGLGLGLPICRSIIAAHRGRLWAEANGVENRVANSSSVTSYIGQGATLYVELPIAGENA